MPLPARMRPDGARMRIYTQLGWGALARFFVLDDRQYRSYQACQPPGRRGVGAVDVAECTRIFADTRTMLGRAQERWLEGALGDSRAGWNVLAQQTRVAQFDELAGPGTARVDRQLGRLSRRAQASDRFPRRAAYREPGRDRRRRALLQRRGAEARFRRSVIGGRRHRIRRHVDHVAGLAAGTVRSADGGQPAHEADRQPLPRLREGRRHAEALRADLRAMESVQSADAHCSTLHSFVVEDGKPGPQRA
jgi:hypothetical protein